MGRAPCCDKTVIKKGLWTAKEDQILTDFIQKNGHENWRALPKKAGLLRCGKSCRLRWINYLKPGIKRGNFSAEEEEAIIKLHRVFGNRWSAIASRLPGRTDNEIKNVWNTYLKKSHLRMETELETHATTKPLTTPDAHADNLGIKFPSETKASANSPTTISNLSDSHNALSELFPCMSNIDSESNTEDSASTSEWLQSNSINSSVGCDQEPSAIGDGTSLEDLLIDERIILENQNFEGEETWFPTQNENSMISEVTWEQSLNLNAHYFMYADPEDDILGGMDGEERNPQALWKGNDDDTTDYWLKVLSQVGTSPLL